jgi:hypothetical protein
LILNPPSINGQWPKVRQAPDPTIIKWENLAVGKTSRFLRKLLVILITIILMIGSFVVIIIAKDYQKKSNDKAGEIECGGLEVSLI